jgi:hypothetical protein
MFHYLGPLPPADPLHPYLQTVILPQFGYAGGPVDWHVFRMHRVGNAFLYEERRSGIRVVGKFFAPSYTPATPKDIRDMEREYENMQLLRRHGFGDGPHRVVRPLGCNADLGAVLIQEQADGLALTPFIDAAVYQRRHGLLFEKLTALAYFLATLHTRTATGTPVDFGADCRYLDHLIRQLREKGIMSEGEGMEIAGLRDRWFAQPRMWEGRQTLVHGDATPTNFLFGAGLQVTAIDLEQVKHADPVFDVGRIAGELQHAFLLGTGDKYGAEPFIGHFLWEYTCHFPDRDCAFAAITRRVPFHMALTLLRIARNTWLDDAHRRRLVEEAAITLRTV